MNGYVLTCELPNLKVGSAFIDTGSEFVGPNGSYSSAFLMLLEDKLLPLGSPRRLSPSISDDSINEFLSKYGKISE